MSINALPHVLDATGQRQGLAAPSRQKCKITGPLIVGYTVCPEVSTFLGIALISVLKMLIIYCVCKHNYRYGTKCIGPAYSSILRS